MHCLEDPLTFKTFLAPLDPFAGEVDVSALTAFEARVVCVVSSAARFLPDKCDIMRKNGQTLTDGLTCHGGVVELRPL